MCKEDGVFADMVNYYLFEKAFEIHKNDPEEKLQLIARSNSLNADFYLL